MTCPQCGAAIQRGSGRFCSHCATALPDLPRITPEEWVSHRERFEAARADAQHAVAMALPAPAPEYGTTVVLPTLFLIGWCATAAFISSKFAEHGGGMAVAPIVMAVVGTVMFGRWILQALHKANAPVQRDLAVVLDERTEIASHRRSDGSHSTTTSYYVLLQLGDGTRRELPTSSVIAGHTTRGDIGLAVTRGGDLIDFHRYRV
ncbi:MAG: DUF2500 family protein [Kofleriaceae bacterium]|jgi:hypothetical protein|nr:DUF2500 family protein [Kofleriaceae bacterium]MBP9166530.1 DUF2500 family protein [Kofleriaceae bacterium]MBP9859432.1 DUF2500 family protein [Kofleriaceae bacterium]